MADMQESRALIGGVMSRATREIRLLAEAGHGFAQVFRSESRNARDRGVRLRALLCRADAVPDRSVQGYSWPAAAAHMLSEDGWVIRSLTTPPSATCLIADDIAIMEVPSGRPEHRQALSVVEDTSVLRLLHDHFDRGWSGAVDILFEDLLRSSEPQEAATIATVAESTWASLIERLAINPDELRHLSSRKFEELVAELLGRDGFEVHLTQQSRDGGRDILAHSTTAAGKHLFYVECKKYDERPVGVEIVRGLYGTVASDMATGGVIVTTSRFTRDALKYARRIENRMSLKDRNELVAWLERVRIAR